MAKVRRTIRKVRPAYAPSIDDQLWPVNVTLLVLGGFVTGELVVLGSFSTDSLWQNAAMLIALLWGFVFAVMYVAWNIETAIARRTQLSLALALLVVAILITLTTRISLFYEIVIEDVERDIVKKPAVTLPEYVFPEQMEHQRAQLAHEKPVDTVVPETVPLEMRKLESAENQPPKEHQPSDEPVPDATPNSEPVPIQKTEIHKTPPHRAHATGKLTRQLSPAPVKPDTVSSPTVDRQSEPKPSTQLEADTTALQPRTTTSPIQRPSQQQDATAESSLPTVQQARRPTPTARQPRPTTSLPMLPRAVRAPAEIPIADEIARHTPADAFQPVPSKPQPAPTIERRTPQSPVVRKRPPNVDIATGQNQPKTLANRASPLPRHQALAQNRIPGPTRTLQQARTPNSSTPVATQAATSEKQSDLRRLEASESGIVRKSTNRSASEPTQTATPETTGSVNTQSIAQNRPRQSTDSPQPSLVPRDDPSETPKRVAQQSQVAASPIDVSSPAVAQSAQARPDITQPRVAALSRSRRGLAGVGQQRNLDRGDLAPRTVTEVASASARRSRATSESPDDNALVTSSKARVPKDRAMADAPSSTLKAQDVEVPDVAGSARPADIDASSSAATRDSSAAQTRGAVTADTSSTDFDTGPRQIVSEYSNRRASGGGEPELHHATQSPRASLLAPAGGAPLAATSVKPVALDASDLAADGGGAPPALVADSSSAATRVEVVSARKQAAGPPTDSDSIDAKQAPGGAPVVATARTQRVTTTNALRGTSAGGGTDKPLDNLGRTFAATIKAEAPVLERTIGGEAMPEGVESTRQSIARQGPPGGVRDKPRPGPTGAAESDVVVNVPYTGLEGSRAGRQRPTTKGGEVPPNPAQSAGGAPVKVAAAANLPGITDVKVDATELAGGGARVQPDQQPIALGAGEGAVQRREAAGRQAVVLAEVGDGGLGVEAAPDAGNPSHKAQHHSEIISLETDSRFPQRTIGGPKHSGNTRARDTQSAFEGRKKRPGKDSDQGTPPRQLEEAIRAGLEFLRLHQSENGSWSFNDFGKGRAGYENEEATIRADVAATGLSLMCFLGAGYDHFDYGGQYTQEIQSAIDYLVSNQQANGDLYLDQDAESSKTVALYSHAIATMAICEAYGMTRDPKLKKVAQRAIKYIEVTQHDERGGWRYAAQTSADLSVTGWMLAALKSGDLAGLTVQQDTYDAVFKYLDRCQANGSPSFYVYNPDAPATQAHGRRHSPAMTAVGLLSRLYQGWDRARVDVQLGADYLAENMPEHILNQRDTYYWYYGTQVMFHMRGSYWEQWERRLHDVLRATQAREGPLAGSWAPRGAVPDAWGSQGGRIYVTALNLLSLEVSYRYLPLYQETDR